MADIEKPIRAHLSRADLLRVHQGLWAYGELLKDFGRQAEASEWFLLSARLHETIERSDRQRRRLTHQPATRG